MEEVPLNPALQARLAAGAIRPSARFSVILDGLREVEERDLSPSQRRKVVETVLACAVLEVDMEAICALSSETERVKAISRACGINAEPGFCEGSHSEAVRSVLEDRLSILCNVFQESKARGNLAPFFQRAFCGDPCLNGRLIAIQRFAFEQETGLSADLLTQQDAFMEHDDIAFKFTELMYGLSFEQPPSKAEFEEYLRNQLDYEQLYKPWVESSSFPHLYMRARELFA